jgi:adenylate kinase family enzyme
MILEELFDKSKSFNEIKNVNKKTFYRIINSYLINGIAEKNENKYSLTAKGKLLALVVLGKFESINAELKNELVFDFKDLFIERKEVIDEIIYNAERKKNILILGESGFGKTALLKRLNEKYLKGSVYCEIKPIKTCLENICKAKGIGISKSANKSELLNKLRQDNNHIIVLLDSIESATINDKKIIKDLMRNNCQFIFAGINNKAFIDFDHLIRLKTLTNIEANQLVNKLLEGKCDNINEVIRIVQNSTNNTPDQIIKVCKQNLALKELNEENKLVEHIKPTTNRINLISSNNVVNIAYLMITMRYLFYGQKQYEIGYWLSTVAYLIFFLFRRRKK